MHALIDPGGHYMFYLSFSFLTLLSSLSSSAFSFGGGGLGCSPLCLSGLRFSLACGALVLLPCWLAAAPSFWLRASGVLCLADVFFNNVFSSKSEMFIEIRNVH